VALAADNQGNSDESSDEDDSSDDEDDSSDDEDDSSDDEDDISTGAPPHVLPLPETRDGSITSLDTTRTCVSGALSM
jgi:hypothetical protein